METKQDENWLLQPLEDNEKFRYRTENHRVKQLETRSGTIALKLYRPYTPEDHPLKEDIVLCASGWTEPGLEGQARAIARTGLAAVAFNHPRGNALRDVKSMLLASRELPANWQELSKAIWKEQDLDPDHIEHVLVNVLVGQDGDKHAGKMLLKSALSAGRDRRDNMLAIVEWLRQEGYSIHELLHSLAALEGVLAAKASPDQIRSLTLAAPAGMVAQDSLEKIIPRILLAGLDECAHAFRNPRAIARTAIKTALFVGENPALVLYEGIFAATGRLEPTIWDLAVDHHIPSILLLGESDPLVQTHVVRNDGKNIPFAETVILPRAGHNMTLGRGVKEVAGLTHRAALDTHNPTSGILMTNMRNRVAQRAHLRPTVEPMTNGDLEADLFNLKYPPTA